MTVLTKKQKPTFQIFLFGTARLTEMRKSTPIWTSSTENTNFKAVFFLSKLDEFPDR